MNDLFFICFIILITSGLIYFLYIIMLGSGKGNKDDELQITSEEILEQIKILHRQKKYNIVENLAKKYLEKKPNDDGVRSILAKALYDSKMIYDAIEHAKVVIKHQPKNFEMQIFLANCYVETAKPMKAINLLEDLLTLDHNNAVAIKELAKNYMKTNQKQSAIKMYERLDDLLESNQEKASNKAVVAEIYIGFMDYEKAIEKYEEILDIYPDDISVKKRLMELYERTADYEAFITLGNYLLEECADDENGLWIIHKMMNMYRLTKDYEKALEYANMAKSHSMANSTESDEDIAKILLEEGNVEESLSILNKLVEQEPKNIPLKKELASAYAANNNFETATLIYKKILDEAQADEIEDIHFEMSNLYSSWGLYLFSQNESAECFKRFSIAVKYSTQNPEIYFNLGNVNKMIKNYNEAISQYKRAIELNPQNEDYYWSIAECYKEIDSVYEQKKAIIEGLKYNPKNAKANYILGTIYEMQNDSQNAIASIKKAIELDEFFTEAKLRLALIMEHLGNKEEAINLYESILSITPDNKEVIDNLKMLQS